MYFYFHIEYKTQHATQSVQSLSAPLMQGNVQNRDLVRNAHIWPLIEQAPCFSAILYNLAFNKVHTHLPTQYLFSLPCSIRYNNAGLAKYYY